MLIAGPIFKGGAADAGLTLGGEGLAGVLGLLLDMPFNVEPLLVPPDDVPPFFPNAIDLLQ